MSENESAFAVYTGKVSPSRGQIRRKKRKDRESDVFLSKLEKWEILQKKKEKKSKITGNTSFNGSESIDSKKVKLFKNMEKKVFGKKHSTPNAKLIKKGKKKSSNALSQRPKKKSNEEQESVLNLQDTSSSTINYNTETNKQKPQKKVKITSKLPILKKDTLTRKLFVSTPRFIRTTEKSESSKKPNSPFKSNILHAVDEFVTKKTKIGSEKSGAHEKMIIKLAEEAKSKADLQESSEAVGEVTLGKILEPISVTTFLRWVIYFTNQLGLSRSLFNFFKSSRIN